MENEQHLKSITGGLDRDTPIGPTGILKNDDFLNKQVELFKQKRTMKIYVNGLKFEVAKDELTAVEICKLVDAPIDNCELTTEDGQQIPLTANVYLADGQHYNITRLSVGGN